MSDARIEAYARALTEIASAEGNLDAVEKELYVVARAVESSVWQKMLAATTSTLRATTTSTKTMFAFAQTQRATSRAPRSDQTPRMHLQA